MAILCSCCMAIQVTKSLVPEITSINCYRSMLPNLLPNCALQLVKLYHQSPHPIQLTTVVTDSALVWTELDLITFLFAKKLAGQLWDICRGHQGWIQKFHKGGVLPWLTTRLASYTLALALAPVLALQLTTHITAKIKSSQMSFNKSTALHCKM